MKVYVFTRFFCAGLYYEPAGESKEKLRLMRGFVAVDG
jgi:hypothetical protein